MTYFSALTQAMSELGADPNAIFLGQAVRYDGTAMFKTLAGIPDEKKIEFPVAENLQLGVATGLALAGYLPVCIFPRINFLLEATSQLVQHLDKLPWMRRSGYRPRVIIRTAVADPRAKLDAGSQHIGDYVDMLEAMLTTVRVQRLHFLEGIVPAYLDAVQADHSTILVEYHEMYGK
jgi:pyruvate/2-oxoglutarate/acetoin dehydrogenase E1 component